MSTPHRGFHVRQHKPWKPWLAMIMLASMMAMFFFLGRGYQDYQLERLQLEREFLLSRIDELESRNHSLVQKNAHLLGGSKIERDAYELANQELVRLQQQLLEQKEELAFYRGIVSPNDAKLGVNLQTFEVRKKNNQNQFSYKMILTKNGKSTVKIRGDTRILIRGEQDGDVSEIDITDLAIEKSGRQHQVCIQVFSGFRRRYRASRWIQAI